MKKMALVFVSTNEAEVLIPALESLFATVAPSEVEVAVVDNASTDHGAQTVAERWPDVKVLRRNTRYGLPSNLNHGIANTSSAYVMLCNSDLLFEPGALEVISRFMDEHPRAGLVAPLLLASDGEPRASARRWYTWRVLAMLKGPWRSRFKENEEIRRSLYQDWDMSSPIQVDWVPCPATVARRAAMEQVGGMDERFKLYFDDVDISLRMHEAGWQVWCHPGARVVHLEQRASVRPFSRAWRWHLISLVKFWVKHRSLRPRRTTDSPG